MSNVDDQPVQLRARVLVELARLDWAKQLTPETLQDVASSAEFIEFPAGKVVHQPSEQITTVYFVVTGRLQATLLDLLGNEIFVRTLLRSSMLGPFSDAPSEESHLLVEAVEPTAVICLQLADLLRLTSKHADFQMTVLRLAANVVKQMVMIDRKHPHLSVLGIVHHSDISRQLTVRLVERLRELGESPCVAGDDARWRTTDDTPFRLLFENGRIISEEDRQALLSEWPSRGRLLIDVQINSAAQQLTQLLSYADAVLWCVRPGDIGGSLPALQALASQVPTWRDKVRIVWILDNDTPYAPYVHELQELTATDFKVTFELPKPNQGLLLHRGIERIVHYLRGIKIGLALGGGAARGMAHLGVLAALEQNGITIDMLAGTSAGAMTGTVYAAGIEPGYATQRFKKDLEPPWIFHRLPGGGYWYLFYKYRSNQFEAMLRKYLHQTRMEQLVIPMITVSVDLVEGEPFISQTGDATRNILDSINLPPLALPIVRSGRALVDGGLLNNVPADVLVSKGCNFVIASSVTAKLEKDFMKIRSNGSRPTRRSLPSFPVALRQQMILHYHMTAVGVQPADFVIAPDVTAFDLSEFTRADEMAAIGAETTVDSLSKLRFMLSKLDAKLFPFP